MSVESKRPLDVRQVNPLCEQALGHPGDPGHPEVREAMEYVADVVGNSDKTLGILAASPESAAEWFDKGARYFAAGLEGFIKQGMQTYLTAVRG